MSPQLLAYPDFDSPNLFIVDTDYSHEGIGTVLSQVQDGIERPLTSPKKLYRKQHHKINVDNLVWLYTDRPNPNLNRKFQSFWSGPYRVTRNLANTLFEIESYG